MAIGFELRSIRNEREYKRALRELDRVWGAPNGSMAFDTAEILIMLISRYEHETEPPIESALADRCRQVSRWH